VAIGSRLDYLHTDHNASGRKRKVCQNQYWTVADTSVMPLSGAATKVNPLECGGPVQRSDRAHSHLPCRRDELMAEFPYLRPSRKMSRQHGHRLPARGAIRVCRSPVTLRRHPTATRRAVPPCPERGRGASLRSQLLLGGRVRARPCQGACLAEGLAFGHHESIAWPRLTTVAADSR
jgi:hypothetical protein